MLVIDRTGSVVSRYSSYPSLKLLTVYCTVPRVALSKIWSVYAAVTKGLEFWTAL